MAGTLRSSLPSRLRQLLSGEGPIGLNVTLDSDTPPKVKAFIDKVIQCPLQDIAIPLSDFSWEYNKGNFHHWRPLFLHFDTYFKTYLSSRKDLLLTDNLTEDDSPFPKQSVLQILRVMSIILQNCHHKGSFSGLEHFKLLLASTDPDILIATLETLSTLVKINPSKLHENGKLIPCGSINSCLLSLAQGWGSKEEGLGLYSSVISNERTHDNTLPSDNVNSQNRVGSTLYFDFHGTHTIHIPDIHMWKEDDLSIMKQLVEKYNVPVDHRFLLLTRVRYAHAFRSSTICNMYTKICLLAFIVLVQSSDSHDELVSLFANEPEYTDELIRIVKSEETISPSTRTLAMNALGSQLAAYSSSHERARILSQSSISFTGGNRVILLNVLQRAISSLNNSSDPSSIAFIESLLQFYALQVMTTSSPGSVIRGSGMVPTFLPLLEDANPTHIHLVCLAVKTLQKLMDYSNSAVTLFRDLGGVDLLTNRLQIEVVRVIESNSKDDSSMNIVECSDTNPDLVLVSSQKRLIRVLLKALGCAIQSGNDVSIPDTLVMIFKNVEIFGGDIYSSTVTLMCELIHKDPTCYTALDEVGLPDAFLASVTAGVLPSSKSISCVPNGLAAICLNAKGLEAVKETSVLRFLIDVFTLKKYVLPMNEAIVPLSNAFEELMRHVTSLKPIGVDLIIEIINKIASIEDNMETEEKENEQVSDSQFIQLSIFHVMVLVHKTMENTESCRLFVELSGIEVLLKLLLRPSITQSTEGMSIGLHSTMVFKSFTQHHSVHLARAFCSSLKDHLKTTLAGFKVVSGSFLLDPKSTPDSRVFPSLFLVEFLLFLAASKDNKWVTALLQEFGNGSKDVLEDIGRIHREILWQLSLLEDSKSETDENTDADVSQPVETDEERFNSFRQFLDPLMRRRMSGFSFESQFFDLMNMYRDLTHSSGSGQSGQRSNPTGQRSHPAGSSDMMRSLSSHITHLFQELGKSMLLPSRRRDDTVTITPSSKSVASVIASITLGHVNFEGYVASTSAKTRYQGKVVEFIDRIVMDKPDSCNPVLLNSLYVHGVVEALLTTFKATFDLLLRAPMETDEGVSKQNESKEMVNGLLVNYCRLMDHLVTSSFILSPSTKHLLTQPLVNGDNEVNGDIILPKDPEDFVKVLQSVILKSILPLWNHPQFTDCNDDVITTVISIIRHVFSGVEMKNVTNVARPSVPPNETTISMIVEMGFSRSRAEEALRQVGSNSVELATEWLFSHPEIIVQEEDDELAQALAMSLGNPSSITNETNPQIEDEKEKEIVQLPPVDDLLSTCKKLLETKESLSFPVHDLLSVICSHENGHYRSNVVTFILEQVNLCNGKDAMLSSLFHVLALLLNEDKDSREVASKNGLVKLASDLLSNWKNENETSEVPKWITAAFLAVDRIFQVNEKLNNDISELLKKEDDGGNVTDVDDQKRLVEISCGYLKNQLPSETVHAVLQLCSTLTKTHSVAVSFLNAGGLPLLLSLPSGSLFVGFDKIAGSIIRHILEDPQTLQQAMESEIRQSVVTAGSRQPNGRLTPRNFITNLTSVISRDPVIFMRATQSVCEIETVGERPYVVLLKDKSKEKEKGNEKEKSQTPVKVKVHRKPPQSFVNVIETLLASVISFTPPVKEDDSLLTDMEIDVASKSENGGNEYIASMAKVVFILKMLTEILLMYSPSVHVLLKRDNEVSTVKKSDGVFHHVLHEFLPFLKNNKKEKKSDVDWRHKLAVKAGQFLVASCVRSTEARKRIFTGINNVLIDFVNSSEVCQPPGQQIQAFVDFLSDVLSARSPTGSLISGEASLTFIDVGLVKSLTQTLKVLDLDHADSLKFAPGVVKVLEVVTKEHVHAAEGNSGKGENTTKPNENSEHEQIENENVASSVPTERVDAVTDDMEHDQDHDDDGMDEEDSENTRVLENGFDSMGIRFEIQQDGQESSQDDEDMSEGDEDDDDNDDGDDDENNDVEGDEEEVHHLPHLDTDEHEDEHEHEHEHEMEEDEFDEEMIEEEDDDDDEDDDEEDDENGGVILGLGEEMNMMNVLDHINVFERNHVFSDDALDMMPVEIFGSRRQGRTTSIYNLLGRTGTHNNTSVPSQHPLLLNPSSSRNADTTPESTSSRLESVFRSLRNARHGHGPRSSMWADDRQSGATNSSNIPSGLEDLLVSQLTPEVQTNGISEPIPENNGISDSIPENNGISDPIPENNAIIDSVPAVEGASQESSESGATLGENLHTVTEVSENPNQETEQNDSNPSQDARIDPAFLDALPDELRAEVLSGPGPVAQPVNTSQNGGDNDNENENEIDPEFLAALPPDIRAEVLAQQQAQGTQRSQPVEMDTESIIATFPSEIREEVLLTSSDAVLSSLTPALVAEANMLRERFASRYNRTLFGMLPGGSRRGESSRANGVVTRRTAGSQPIETDGAPLVDMEDLKAMIRLLRVVQPIYKPQLQRLLLNLCAHVNTRADVVKTLMDFLVLDARKASSDLNGSESLFRLYSSQNHLMYSRPQSFDGVPPLVSRRVLETLTYLARNHKFVAKLLLRFKILPESSVGPLNLDQGRGKAVMVVEDDETESCLAITLLLSLLKQPLYLRSITHLEQLLNLLDVIIDNAESKKESDDKSSKDDDNDASKPSSSSSNANQENESHDILMNLPQQELRLLCSLLARESLSDNVYTLVADILKKLVAISPNHSHLFITELAISMKNLTPLSIKELNSFTEIQKSTSNSDGTAILRVIQSLSSLVSSLKQQKENSHSTLPHVTEINTALEPLWIELSSCITKIETNTNPTPDESITLPPGTQTILPYIESFFVTSEKLHFGQPENDDEKNPAFVKFSEKHKKILNAFIRQNPGLLEKSFAVILRVPRVIDFDNKRSHFRSKIKSQSQGQHGHEHHGSLRVSVRRAYILEDSYNQLRMRSTEEMKGRLTVHFQGEEGIDAGGLTREWYQLLSRVIFDKGALLFTTVGNESTFQPNPNSVYQTEHLSYFKFIGRVVGKALFDGQLLDVHFTRSFYKHMLGVKVTYHDIEAIDPGYFKNLKWMLENDISDILDLTFSIDADEEKLILYEKGKVTDYELIPNGRNIRVTEENKHEYVDLIAEHRLTTAIRPQINAFLEGFNELVPRDFISIFHDKELELLISGLPDIDLDDMRANTEYSGYSVASPVVQWFWEVAQGLSKEDKARLLQFVTGTSKVPLEGFSALQGISGSQKFQIHKAYGSIDHLPSAHTCFNQLDLPEYPSKQHLEERLLLAIHEANEGFGFG